MTAVSQTQRSAGSDTSRGSQSMSTSFDIMECSQHLYSYFANFHGCFDSTNQFRVFSRAYVQMRSAEGVADFARDYDGHMFRSKDGEARWEQDVDLECTDVLIHLVTHWVSLRSRVSSRSRVCTSAKGTRSKGQT